MYAAMSTNHELFRAGGMDEAYVSHISKTKRLCLGTNDKAGGPHYMLKWASAQAVKQTFVPQLDVGYPYMKK